MRCGKKLLEGLEGYSFLADFQGENFFHILDQQYPGSKFTFTIRDEEAWVDSRRRHVLRNQQLPNYKGTWLTVDEEAWRDRRSKHIKKITDYFSGRPNDLLVMDICAGDGWEKLCPFLGKDIPDIPFPHVNKSSSEV